MKKIGLFGGTFNPPHLGHMLFAQEACLAYELDELWFIPVNVPPHKESDELASNDDRITMLKKVTERHKTFSVSTIEVEREGPSYTVDTVKLLKKQYPDEKFYFLIGGDMIDYLPHWHRIDELMTLVTFIGTKRPGSTSASAYSGAVELLDMVQVDYSSTMIRQRIAEGKPITYMVPDEVEKFIKERGLYEARRSPATD